MIKFRSLIHFIAPVSIGPLILSFRKLFSKNIQKIMEVTASGDTGTVSGTTEEVKKLLKRLTEAERRSKLLHKEIKDIRTQISTLTQAATGLLGSTNTNRNHIGSVRDYNTLASTSTAQTKRQRDDDTTDFNGLQQKRPRDDIPQDSNGYAVAYTDGACENNGKANAKAGIGVWFSSNCPLNISKPVVGRATNNTAEIQAPTEALKVLLDLGYSKVKILTDSQFTINCITKWMKKWKTNNWKLASGGPVKNKEDLVKLDSICQKFQDIKWEYCAGHKGILGNEEADKLAREGALRYRSS